MSIEGRAISREAYRAAGHAAAAHAMGVDYPNVSLQPGNDLVLALPLPREDASGTAENGDHRAKAEREIIVCLAGMAAERRFEGDSINWARVENELLQAGLVDVVLGVPPPAANERIAIAWRKVVSAYLAYLRLRADELIEQEQAAVAAIAERLEERGTLSAEEIARMAER